MTEEEWQRKMEFIVEQQSHFSANIERLGEAQVQAEKRMTKIEDVVLRLANLSENRFAILTERMTELASAQANADARIAELAEKGAETDSRLNTLIDVVERHISEGHNGKPQS